MTTQQKPPALAGAEGKRIFKNESVNSTTGTPPIERILSRLEGVKVTGPRKWLALCPSHPDKRPSLSIRETEDNTVLLHCWSGCGAVEVVAAAGLKPADLFPRTLSNRPALRPGERWIPRDALAGVAHEAMLITIAGEQVAAGTGLTREALDRVALAAGRLRAAAREVGCHE